MSDQEQGAQPQDQPGTPADAPAPAQTATPEAAQATPTPPPAQPPQASQGSPWANDLASKFEDEATRQNVDSFLRETVQPHVTKVEQEAAKARQLWESFETTPDQTFEQVAASLYGEEHAKAIGEYLREYAGESEVQQPQATPAEYPPEVQALIEEKRARDDEAAYDAELSRIKQVPGNENIDRDLFIPFAAQADTFEEAAAKYHEWESRFRETANPAATQQQPPSEPAPTAPPTVGQPGVEGGTPTPTEKKYESLNDAIDDFAAELAASGQEVAPPIPTS